MATTLRMRTRPGRSRFALVALLTALIAFGVFAASAPAADNWTGVWNTKHKFDKPKLDIELIKKGRDDAIKGVYYDDGNLRGHIRGARGKEQGVEFWSGTFRDVGVTNSKGKFTVILQSDQVSLVGWFKSCGTIGCSERYKWTGEHA